MQQRNTTQEGHLISRGGPQHWQVWYFISRSLKISIHSRALLAVPQLVSCSVGVTSSCSLLAFPLSVSLSLLHLRCLYSSTCNCARLLIIATPVLKAAIKSTNVRKVTWQNVRDVCHYGTRDKWGHTTNRQEKRKAILGPAHSQLVKCYCLHTN